MDPASPHGAAPPRRRHAAPAGPDDPGAGGTAVVDRYGGYDDGRHDRASSTGRTVAVARPTRAPRARALGSGSFATAASAAPAGLGGPDRRTPVRPDRRGRDGATPTARRLCAGILAGAFLMLVVASLDSFVGAQVPVLGSFAASGGGAGAGRAAEEAPPLPPPPDTAGTCLSWTRPDAADTSAVDCARPHMFEQAGNVKLLDQPAFPADQAWQKLVAERCTPVVTGYLKGKFDPDGKFRVGALKPSEQRWEAGDRGMRCGLQAASRTGQMFPIIGRVGAQDQSAVMPPGTCLGIDGRTVGDPVDSCAQPHAVETVGIVDLGQQFKDRMPSVDDQDGFLQPACQQAANGYAGNDQVIAQKKLTVYWNNLSEASWNAGSRKVNCNLATLLPDGSGFAPISGSIKGPLAVGNQPAPAAGAAPAPPGDPSTTPPAGDTGPAAPSTGPAPSTGSGASGGPVAPTAPPPASVPDNPLGLPGLQP